MSRYLLSFICIEPMTRKKCSGSADVGVRVITTGGLDTRGLNFYLNVIISRSG